MITEDQLTSLGCTKIREYTDNPDLSRWGKGDFCFDYKKEKGIVVTLWFGGLLNIDKFLDFHKLWAMETELACYLRVKK